LHLLTLRGLQVLHFTFESATFLKVWAHIEPPVVSGVEPKLQ